jgi:nucleoside-triphosphatase THEP1
MSQIFIYSGTIRSGKTTRLDNWIKKTSSVDGVLTPIINGKRYIKFVSTGKMSLLESDLSDASIVEQIGKYKFLKNTFHKSHEYLLRLIINPPKWIVIDEIGFLELDGMGFEPAVSQLMNKLKNKSDVNILLVVRDFLKDNVINYYKIKSDSWKDFNPDEQY